MALSFIEQKIEEGEKRVADLVRPKLEPETELLPFEFAASASLAISMKRIADVLDDPARLHFTDAIMFAIEQAIANATRR